MDYKTRMIGYYPEAVKRITEIQTIIDSESEEIQSLHDGLQHVLDNAWLPTMHEDRIAEWESRLSIVPNADDTIEDRRAVIVSTVLGTVKINANTISDIVGIFTNGGTAEVSISGSTITVKVHPPMDSVEYKFDNLVNVLKQKIPAHLTLVVTKHYITWNDVKSDYTSWNDVKTQLEDWESLLEIVPN